MSIKPKTYLIGSTDIDMSTLCEYLKDTNNWDFMAEIEDTCSRDENISAGEILCSFYAKLCYKSLSLGKNANVSKVRAIHDNLKSVFDSGHGSVFEHCWLNFITTNCSRVFTHELVRHRVGTAFSQTSGRYVAIDQIDIVLPPELDVDPEVKRIITSLRLQIQHGLQTLRRALIPAGADFATKKRLTSAIRRLAPNGQTNEIGWSCNIRALRHMIEMRTSRHAEWEIRYVFNEVANIVQNKWPLILYGGKKEEVDGDLAEWTNLKL